jgi:magnesium-transporting ATPase (P-type)
MKNEEIKDTWKTMESIENYSKEELENILRKKTKRKTDAFLYPVILRMLIMPILCTILILSLVERWEYEFYRYNNIALCGFFLFLLYSSVISFYRIQFVGPNLPLKNWLERWVKYKYKLEKSIFGYLLLPFFLISVYLSVNLYQTDRSIMELINNTSNLIALLSALIVPLLALTAIVWMSKRKYSKSLQYLEDYYNQLMD